ncbi:MAG: hypothetical protein J5I98_02935 [Phaeodactylibacter sp.]|nr:hypothetical protein [Phaeodactylibacter sp.]
MRTPSCFSVIIAFFLMGSINAATAQESTTRYIGQGYLYGNPARIEYSGSWHDKSYNYLDYSDLEIKKSRHSGANYSGKIYLNQGTIDISISESDGSAIIFMGPKMQSYDLFTQYDSYSGTYFLSIWTSSLKLINPGPVVEVGRFQVKKQ